MKKTLLSLLLCASAGNLATHAISIDQEVNIYCIGGENNRGVYTISPSTGTPVKISGSTYIQYDCKGSGGTFTDTETLYGTKVLYGSYYQLKATAAGNEDGIWSHSIYKYQGFTQDIVAYDMAYNESDGKIYGCFKIDGSSWYFRFGTYDGETGTVTAINSQLTLPYNALAFDGEGTLWGVRGTDLVVIDTATGTATVKASLPFTTGTNPATAAIDRASGKMYVTGKASAYATIKAVYEIDLRTLESTKKFDFSSNTVDFTCFFIPGADDKSIPAATTDLRGVFTGNGKDVKVSCTAPSTDKKGGELKGSLRWALTIDGEAPAADAEGTIEPGAPFEKTYAMDDGWHKVAISFSNDDGKGAETTADILAGYDTPTAVSGITLEQHGASVDIAWEAPAAKNGGLLDESAITYSIMRLPDSTAVATAITALSASDMLPEGNITAYSYVITVNCNGTPGESATSPTVNYGDPYTVPYSQDFTDASAFSAIGFKAENTQGHDLTWVLDDNNGNRCAVLQYNRFDYPKGYALYLPMMSLQSGKTYTLGFKASISLPDDSGQQQTDMRILLSRSQSLDTDYVIEPAITDNFDFHVVNYTDRDLFIQKTFDFSVEEDGIYSICLYEKGTDNYNNVSKFCLDDITVKEKNPSAIGAIEADGESRVEIFDLRGIRLYNGSNDSMPSEITPGVYVIVKDGKAEKKSL